MGDQSRAWEIGARALLNPEAASPLLSRLYPQRYPEAQGWWTFFRLRDASEPPAATFARVHRVMVPVADDAEEFAKLAAEAETVAMAQDVSYGGGIVAAVGEAALRRRQFELACRLLDAAREVNPNVPSLLAEALWRSQQWAKAAATSEALWERDHEQLTALYLTGEALQRAGREDEGRQRKEQAVLLALDSRARLNLAVGLKQHGLQEEAVQQFQIVLRTAPFESWEWQAAAHYLAERMQDEAPGEAAALFEQSLLDDLRTQSYLLADKDYLVTPSLTHRLRAAAAVGAGQWEAADHHIQRALSALPGDTALTEHLVPPLEKAGRQQEADELFKKVLGVYAEGVQAYPDAALLHNNLAWMCARCGRRLDEAQQHAERAVALEPDNAGYIDTLAEVRFQRGDREAAVRHSRRAVQLRPDDETLQRQLDRFQQAPLPDRSK